MQKSDKRRDSTSSRLKKLWKSPKELSLDLPSDSESGNSLTKETTKCNSIQQQQFQSQPQSNNNKPACSLPLLQIWPANIDSPRNEEVDKKNFIYSAGLNDDNNKNLDTTTFIIDESSSTTKIITHQLECLNINEHGGDSGIDSIQASPSPIAQQPNQPIIINNSNSLTQYRINSPTPSEKQAKKQRFSKLLHPDHARIIRPTTSPDNSSIEDHDLCTVGNLCTASSSTTSSQTSIAANVNKSASSYFKRLSDPWLHRITHHAGSDGNEQDDDMSHDKQRRRSTGRCSMMDALDLEYVLMRAAARGSVGPYSVSESMHKLTFTQSLAFPALARSITSKRRRSVEHTEQRPLDPNESSLGLLAKFVTACVLVMISFLVFLIVYKFSVT